MLALTIKSGEYIRIGENIVVQVMRTGEIMRIAIDAPRELQIERAKHLEARGETPECIQRVRSNTSKRRFKADKSDRSAPI